MIIITKQMRRHRAETGGWVFIEHPYKDKPASLETWIDHCMTIADEFGMSALDVHKALFAQLPEIFGRSAEVFGRW